MTALEAHRAKNTSQLLFTIHECKTCSTRTDVSRFQPGQKLLCPGCGSDFFVEGLDEATHAATPTPRVVSGPTKGQKKKAPLPWAKIGMGAAVAVVLGTGIFLLKKARDRNEITVLAPEEPASPKQPRAANAGATAAASLAPWVVSRSGVLPGVYIVKNVKSGLALDVMQYGTGLDARLHTEPVAKTANQRWILRPVTEESWELINFHSFKALEPEGGSSEDAARLAQTKVSGATAQLWRLDRMGDAFQIIDQGSGKALAQTDDLPKGAHLGQRTPGPGAEQLWVLENQTPLPREMAALLAGPGGKAPAPVGATAGGAPIDGRFIPIPLDTVANGDSREGLFGDSKDVTDSVHPKMTGWVRAGETPFQLLPTTGKNVVLLRGGFGEVQKKYTTRVEIPMGGVRLTKLHFLGGVAAWGYPWGSPEDDHFGSVLAKVILVHADGTEEALTLRNGIEFVDHHDLADVPGSTAVTGLVEHGRQIRTYSRAVLSAEPVVKIVLQGYSGHATPVFLAMTGETAR